MKKVLRFLGVFIAVCVVLTGLALTGFYLWLNSYLQSEDFRTMVSTSTSKELHLQGDYLPFHWTGLSVHSDGYFAKGADDQPINFVRADQIRADLNLRPVLRRIWNLTQIDIQSLEVELRSPMATATEATPAAPEPTPAPTSSSSFLTRFLPTDVQIDRISISTVNLSFKPGPPVTLRNLEVTLTPEGHNAWNIDGRKGKLKHPDWPLFTVDRAKLRATNDQLFVTLASLQMENNGLIEVSGDLDFRNTSPIHLLADVKQAPVTAFLAGDWRARLTGTLSGQVKWTGDLRGPEAVQAKGTMKLIEGRIEALPFLNQIAALTKTEEFRSLKLHKASADFIWIADKDRLEVTNLVLESEGLVRVQGKFSVEKDIIDGKFSIGTVPTVLKYVPGAESQVFVEKRDGYIWAPLNLTGPIQSPDEDLTPKLRAAAINSIGESANQGLQNVIDAAKSLLPF